MQLGTCPTVDSQVEDEAVKGWICPGPLGEDQVTVASREGDSRCRDGYAKSLHAPLKEPRLWCQPVCPFLGLWHVGSSNWLKVQV